MLIFEFTDYKSAIKDLVLARKQSNPSLTFERLATACGMQKTYLSRALNRDDVHFSSDQLFLACEFLKLREEERTFLELLHRHSRTSVARLRQDLERKISEMRKNHVRTETYVTVESVLTSKTQSFINEYYLDPNMQLIHLFLTIERYAKSPELIQKQLGLDSQRFSHLLAKLVDFGLIAEETRRSGHRYRVMNSSLHLPVDSPINRPYQALMRLQSSARASAASPDQSYSYSVFFSTDPETRKEIQIKFMEWLESIRKQVQRSEPSDVYQLCFDLVDWSTVQE
jgi:hypothetical protein